MLLTVSTTLPEGLKEQFQAELHQPGVCTRRRRGHDAKILIVGTAAHCVRRRELRSVKQVKEFCPEFDTQAFAARESSSLE